MAYEGDERRQPNQEYCSQHIELTKVMVKVSTSVENIEKQLTESQSFKTAMISSIIGIMFIVFIQIGTFAFLYGQLVQNVKTNTGRLNVLESGANLK